MSKRSKIVSTEICNECGHSVKPGSGLFVNRIPDFNDYQTRIEMGKPFPEGEYICIICDEKITSENFPKNELRN